jgi:nitroreductase
MDRRELLRTAATLGLAVAAVPATGAGGDGLLELPPPRSTGGISLTEALRRRQSGRAFSARKLPPEVLSTILWAGFGINRPQTGGRTAPSAHDWQEIEVWCAMEEGLFRYLPKPHALQLAKAEDVRTDTGLQDFTAGAPLNLVFVADLGRMGSGDAAEKSLYAAADTGFICQNVYLACAQEGLATVVRGWLDRDRLARVMGLGADRRIVFAQTVGYPAG